MSAQNAPKIVPLPIAKKPERRTVTVTLDEESEFPGWYAAAYADFPAGLLADLMTRDIAKIIAVLDRIVIAHNMPNEAGELAESMSDVDPYDGLLEVSRAIFNQFGTLPNR